MEYAIISGGFVTDVIVADQAFIDTAYPGSPRIDNLDPVPGIGWAYNGSTFTPPAPPVTVPDPPVTLYSPQAFRARYTLDELIVVDNFAEFPGISDEDRQKMLTITTSLISAAAIDISSPNVVDAVNFEVQVGLITQSRADQILNPASPPPFKAEC
jgi:hypothetical protein